MADVEFDNTDLRDYKAGGILEGKVAIVTGGSSGIGQAAAIAFAKEGAKVVIGFLGDEKGALKTIQLIENYGGKAVAQSGDLRS